MNRIAGRKRRKVTKRFYINVALFAILLTLGIIFKEQYVSLRDSLRGRIIGAAESIVDDIQTSELSLQMPSLTLGANSRKLTGSGEQIDDLDTQTPTNPGSNLSFPARMYPYRAMLNETAQAVYNQVYANAMKLNSSRFTLVTPVTEEALADIMNAVYNDHPELFWVDTAYSYGFVRAGSVVTVTLSFNETARDIQKAQTAFDRAVQTIVDGAGKFSTDIDKEKYVHDHLVDRVSYDTASKMNQSAYSALVGDSTVCAGFSRAFQHVLMQLDIPCYYSTGTAAGGDHAWNIVALGGDYYNVDVAWDDATTSAYGGHDYSYFNVPDSQFSSDHTRSAISTRLPACTGTAMTYAAVYGGSTQPSPGTSASNLPTYQDKGYVKSDIISTLSGYNAYCREQLISRGTGTHTLRMVLKNAALMHEIYTAAENEAYVSDYAQAVVNALRLQNCSISLQLSGETLANGYILLTQVITLKGDTAPAPVITARPTATPAATPALSPSAEPTAAPSPTPPQSVQTQTPAQTTLPPAAETPVSQQATEDPWAIPAVPDESPAGDNNAFDEAVGF